VSTGVDEVSFHFSSGHERIFTLRFNDNDLLERFLTRGGQALHEAREKTQRWADAYCDEDERQLAERARQRDSN